jgi:hypothetical protein
MNFADLDKLSDDDLSRAVLNAMYPLPRVIVTGVIPVQVYEVEHAEQGCRELRAWLDTQSLPKRIHNAYLHWIEFCETSTREARDELRTGRKRKEFEDGQRRLENRQRIATEASRELPRPPR